MILWPSYHLSVISYNGKMASAYWIKALAGLRDDPHYKSIMDISRVITTLIKGAMTSVNIYVTVTW